MNRQELTKKVKETMEQIISKQGYVSAVDLFIGLNMLSPKDYEAWRRRQVPYLEKVIMGSLGQISSIMSTFRTYAQECKLKPSWTAYNAWGKGTKDYLRFSKSGLETIEKAYATHYVINKT